MKKKGLIISTVVMVVVLIAALTTATFAWFSSSATAAIEDIEMSVTSSAKVLIGVGTGTSRTGYHNGDVTFTNNYSDTLQKANAHFGTWGGSTTNLGTTVNTGLSLDVSKAVGTSASGSSMDASLTETSSYYVADMKDAKGTNDHTNLNTPAEARINGTTSTQKTQQDDKKTDVIDLEMGIIPATKDVYGMFGLITITVPADQTYLGMIAALHIEITADSKTYTGELFAAANGSMEKHWNEDTSSSKEFKFYFIIKDKGGAALNNGVNDVVAFSIKFFISGYDPDCCNDAAGTSATIGLSFDGIGENDQFATVASGAKQITLSAGD